jgi:DNA-binding MarR family transcriptional regulator
VTCAASPADHAPLSYALALAAFAQRGQMQRLLGRYGIHLGQERMVFELARHPGISQSALATRLGVEQPTVAKAVVRLARQGLVAVGRDEQDARVTRLFLTDQGRQLLDPIVACWQALDERMGQGMSQRDRERLRVLLVRCASNLSGKGEPDES